MILKSVTKSYINLANHKIHFTIDDQTHQLPPSPTPESLSHSERISTSIYRVYPINLDQMCKCIVKVIGLISIPVYKLGRNR
jgi:hypothetical protein